jgi:hypothetical protein
MKNNYDKDLKREENLDIGDVVYFETTTKPWVQAGLD